MTEFPNPTGRPCLNLIATVGSRLTSAPNDRLRGPADLDEWLASQGLLAMSSTRADLANARALREAIYSLVTSAMRASEPDHRALGIVNNAARHAPRPQLTWTTTGYTAPDPKRPLSHALAAVAADAVDLLSGPDRHRLHQCEAEHCATVFLDGVTNRPRRWCSSKTCGNRARVTAHRQRTRD